MRRVAVTAILLTVTFAQFGTVSLLMIQHQRGRRRTESLRQESFHDRDVALTHVVVGISQKGTPDPELQRVGRHEVRFEGHLYDIVYEQLRGDSLHLWVEWDEAEEEAASLLAESLDGSGDTFGVATVSTRAPFLRLHYLSTCTVGLSPRLREAIQFGSVPSTSVELPFGEVPHPPPRG